MILVFPWEWALMECFISAWPSAVTAFQVAESMSDLDLLAISDFPSSYVTRKKRHKHKHMNGVPRVPPNSPGSCHPAGWELHMPWEFVLVLICQCQRSLRRHGTATKIHCHSHCQSFAWQALQTNRYIFLIPKLSLIWVRFGQPGSISRLWGPSALLLPMSLLQLSLAGNAKQELQVGIHCACQFRETMETMQGSWQVLEAAFCLLKGQNHTPWSILPPATGMGQTKIFVYISTRMCRQCNLCLVVFCGWGFLCFAGRHK